MDLLVGGSERPAPVLQLLELPADKPDQEQERQHIRHHQHGEDVIPAVGARQRPGQEGPDGRADRACAVDDCGDGGQGLLRALQGWVLALAQRKNY